MAQRLMREKAKIELSSVTSTNINLPFITATADGPKHLDVDLTRAKFESLISDLVEKTAGPVRQSLSDANLSAADIDKVILVGGSTRVPLVQKMLKDILGKSLKGRHWTRWLWGDTGRGPGR